MNNSDETNYCPRCGLDLLACKQSQIYVRNKERQRIYEEVKAELAAAQKQNITHIFPASPSSSVRLISTAEKPPKVNKRKSRSTRIEVTDEMKDKIKELRQERGSNGEPLKIKEIAERMNLKESTVGYVVYSLLTNKVKTK